MIGAGGAERGERPEIAGVDELQHLRRVGEMADLALGRSEMRLADLRQSAAPRPRAAPPRADSDVDLRAAERRAFRALGASHATALLMMAMVVS